MAGNPVTSGPDLSAGTPIDQLRDGEMVPGHVDGAPVVLVRRGAEFFAVGGTCTHWSGPLGEGLVVGETIRCPWHHACFSLRTGEALHAPALRPIPCHRVEVKNDMVYVGAANDTDDGATRVRGSAAIDTSVGSIVIVGGGAAGNAAAEMLRRRGYAGQLSMVSADSDLPYDRPNLSKDYLAGKAEEAWIPLRDLEFYAEHEIDVRLGIRVEGVDVSRRRVALSQGGELAFDRLLLATGAEPIHLDTPGASLTHVYYVRTWADTRRIIAAASTSQRAVVIGASFIGLEVAASLRTRGLSVDVVAPESVPLERIVGTVIGKAVQATHEAQGVRFHLGHTGREITPGSVTLDDGSQLNADMVVIGVGVRPQVVLAQGAGAAVDNGVLVDEFLETSVPGIFAAGDIARYPDLRSGQRLRVEHWVVAQRQGQVAARNMIGERVPFDSVPFFWSSHFATTINYVGNAREWDELRIAGDPAAADCAAFYRKGGGAIAVATIGRDRQSLEAEAAMERGEAV